MFICIAIDSVFLNFLELESKIGEVVAREAVLKTEAMGIGYNHSENSAESVTGNPYFDANQVKEHEPNMTVVHPTSSECTPFFDLAKRFHLPNLEMSTFDGEVGKYKCFMRAFHSNIVSRVSH